MDKDKKGFSIGLTDFINFSSLYEFKFIWLKQPTLVELPRDFKLRCVFFFFAFVSKYDWIFKDQSTNIINCFFPVVCGVFFGHTYLYSSTAENPTQTTKHTFLNQKSN